MVFIELREVEHVGGGERLLHLIQFVSTDCVEVSPYELFLENRRLSEVVEEVGHAFEVVGDKLAVLSIFKSDWVLELFAICFLLSLDPLRKDWFFHIS